MEYPTNSDDVIDSRDVIAAIEEFTTEIDSLVEEMASIEATDERQSLALALAEMREQLSALSALADEASGYAADWLYGETLIRDSYFREFTEQTVEDCGYFTAEQFSTWPYRCIDWEQAARELQMDYTSVDFDGVTYWIR